MRCISAIATSRSIIPKCRRQPAVRRRGFDESQRELERRHVSHSYLDTLHALTGKPVMVSEFYMAAEENAAATRIRSAAFPRSPLKRERQRALANTLRSLVRLPYVVGADWFQYYDEPPHGRKLDGEDYNSAWWIFTIGRTPR